MNQPLIDHHLQQTLRHLYISPLEQCNLNCRLCYTRKTTDQLSILQIQDFIKRYQQVQALDAITFCGGEVFLLDWFVPLVNQLTTQGLLIEIITNGTIDQLAEFKQPNLINLIISLDGLPKAHDANRGQGNFDRSFKFFQQAQKMDFHTEIFTVVSQHNFDQLAEFEQFLQANSDQPIEVTYHPRKPLAYLDNHPLVNETGQIKGFEFLTAEQILQFAQTRKIFPPIELGCYQLSLMSTGQVYACCEGVKPIGQIDDDISDLLEKFKQQVAIPTALDKHSCLGCTYPDFNCGVAKIYAQFNQINNQENSP